jgi:CBS domain containing-hemolysin-like protein
MDVEPWVVWGGACGSAAAVGLSVTWLNLINFTGGKVRRLEAQDRELAERLEPWLAKRDEYRILLRLLLLLDSCLLFYCYAAWEAACRAGLAAPGPRFGVPAAIALLFFILSEFLGRHLSALAGARLLAAAMPAVWVLGLVFFPFSLLIRHSHRWAERWHERRRELHGLATAEDEILSLIERESEEETGEDDLAEDERRMIQGVFDLDETLVHEIMTPRVDIQAIDENASFAEVKARIIASGHSRIPVFHDTIDHVVGVVFAKDLLDEARLAQCRSLADLQHQPVFIPETKNVGDLLAEFQQSRNHFAIVLDEYGGTAGLVTFEDILEEIVGDIQDEYDDEEEMPASLSLPDGFHVVESRLTIDEVNELLDLELSEEESYDTLAGYIAARCGHIPQQGESGRTEALEFEILEADQRRVMKLKIRKLDEANRDEP